MQAINARPRTARARHAARACGCIPRCPHGAQTPCRRLQQRHSRRSGWCPSDCSHQINIPTKRARVSGHTCQCPRTAHTIARGRQQTSAVLHVASTAHALATKRIGAGNWELRAGSWELARKQATLKLQAATSRQQQANSTLLHACTFHAAVLVFHAAFSSLHLCFMLPSLPTHTRAPQSQVGLFQRRVRPSLGLDLPGAPSRHNGRCLVMPPHAQRLCGNACLLSI